MATKNGGWVSGDDYRVVMDYSVSNNSDGTTCTVSVTTKIQVTYYLSNYNVSWSAAVGSNSASGTKTISVSGSTYTLGSKSVTNVNRGTSASSVTVSASCNAYGSSSTSASVTIPARASYAITYNANGGSGAPAAQTKYHGTAITLQTGIPTRTNYEFLGWSTNSSATAADSAYTKAKMTAGVSYTTNAALTLYAVWKLAFVAPTLSKLTAFRSNSSGASDPSSTSYIHVDVTWSVDTAVTSGNKGKTVAVAIKSGSTQVASGSSTVSTTSGTTSFTLAPTTSGDTFSGAYIVTATITDTNNQTATKTASISVVFKPFTMANKGKSAAFFGIADSLATNMLKLFGRLWIEGRQETWVSGVQGNAAINFYKKVLNANSWNPSLMFQTKGGGAWEVGNHDGEELRFVYFTATKIANSTNTADATITLNSNGTINANKAWTQLATAKAGTEMTFTLPTNCTEVMVAAVCTYAINSIRSYAGSVVIPRVLLNTTNTEWLLGGGKASSASSASGQRYASIQITTTKATGVGAYVDGTGRESTTTFYIYWR